MIKLKSLINETVYTDIWYHGSPSGDLRGGISGLHLGTFKASKEALEAKIGIKSDGTDLDGADNIEIIKKGLVDDGVYGYEMKSPYSYLRYRYEPSSKMFYLDNIATPNLEDQNKGYAKAILESFFQFIKQKEGALDVGSYTTSGMSYIKPLVEKFSQQYNVRLVQGSRYD